jgi:hypothetical protein
MEPEDEIEARSVVGNAISAYWYCPRCHREVQGDPVAFEEHKRSCYL